MFVHFYIFFEIKWKVFALIFLAHSIFVSAEFPLSLVAEKLGTVQSRKLMGLLVLMIVDYLKRRDGRVKVEVGGVAGVGSRSLPLGSGSVLASGLSQQHRAQQHQQQQPEGGRRHQRGLARVGAPAAPSLWLAAGLLTQHTCVGWGTVAAVVDAHPTILAAQEFVVTDPGCCGSNVKTRETGEGWKSSDQCEEINQFSSSKLPPCFICF